MFDINGESSIKDFFKASIASIIDAYDNMQPILLDGENTIDIDGPIPYTYIRYHYIAMINGHKIYIDKNDDIYEYQKKRILFLWTTKKMVHIGKPFFITDIALLYKTHSVYDYIMKKRDRYFEKKYLAALFKRS